MLNIFFVIYLKWPEQDLQKNRMTYDDVYKNIGSFGRYQKIIYVLQTLPVLFAAVQTYLSVFILYVPDHS